MAISPERQDQIVALAQLLGTRTVDTSGFSDADWAKHEQQCRSEAMAFLHAATPDELHMFAGNWNWDEGPEMMQVVAASDNCDAGTALMIYWRSAPEWYRQFGDRDAAAHAGNIDSGPLWDLQSAIETRFANADFRTTDIAFDPGDDDGLPLIGVYDDFRDKFVRDLPAIMYEPVNPKAGS